MQIMTEAMGTAAITTAATDMTVTPIMTGIRCGGGIANITTICLLAWPSGIAFLPGSSAS
jgi:hypothetical protein